MKYEGSKGEIVLYKGADGDLRLEARFHDESIWLSANQMAELFDIDKSGISRHLKNVFESGELDRNSVIANFATTAADGKTYQVEYYNLDAIISVGYRVQSIIATRFRIWATQRLREYIVKGFVMDDERLKDPPVKGSPVRDYFSEMLERIRDIRTSEKRVYLRVREIFAMAADYEPKDSETASFFAAIQNKLHYAATGMTAAEIISSRADHARQFMGLTSWKYDEVRKADVTIAKNYLSENEIEELNRIVVMWLDFAEDQARRRKQIFLKNWEERLHDFLKLNDRPILTTAGKVSRAEADEHAETEFDKYAVNRRIEKESMAEKDYLNQLEATAKALPSKTKPKNRN